MGLDAIVRAAVATANRLTADLQPLVSHESWTGHDGDGAPTFAAVVQRPALVEWQQKMVRTLSGAEAVSRSKVTFLSPVEIDERDRIVLPDGTTGPILDMSGLVDPLTGRVYMPSVWLG